MRAATILVFGLWSLNPHLYGPTSSIKFCNCAFTSVVTLFWLPLSGNSCILMKMLMTKKVSLYLIFSFVKL